MWWDIIKSTRGEAYSAFLEEFGPEVNLKSLEVENFLDDPAMQDAEYYLSLSNISDEIGYWVVQSNGADIRFVSDEYPQYGVFVEGMFEHEYPERYKEIVGMLIDTNAERQSARNDLIQLIRRYLDVSYEIMESTRDRIENRYGDSRSDTATKSVLIPISSPYFVRMKPESVIPKINPNEYTKSSIIGAIAELVVDSTISGIHILRNKGVERRVNARLDERVPILVTTKGFRNSLNMLYNNLFITSCSGGRKPQIMVSNESADKAANELIDYLKVIAEEYLEGES